MAKQNSVLYRQGKTEEVGMSEIRLGEIYTRIKQSHDARLLRVLTILGKRASNDAEIAEAIRLLRPLVTGQGQFEGDSSEQNQDGEDVSQWSESLTKSGGNQDER